MERKPGTSTINISAMGGSDHMNEEIQDLVANAVETASLDDGVYMVTITVTNTYDA